MSDAFAPRSMKRKNVKGLALTPAAPKQTASSNNDQPAGWGAGGSRADDGQEAQLEIGIEFNLDLRQEDIEIVKELGSGNGGTVSKVKHLPTGTTMARKVFGVIQCTSSRATTNHTLGHPRRSKKGTTETNRARTPDHARLPFRLHRNFLWCVFKRSQRCHNVYGVYGRWVSGILTNLTSRKIQI